ncbi:MAG: hemerythrin domain-containing protein [Acidimicrobiales bacterium]
MSTATPALTAATDLPDLTGYRGVHHALRTATHRLAVAAADMSPNDAPRVRALRRYWNGFAGEVHAHHTVEDDVFFPALGARSPQFAEYAGQLADDHHVLDELMLDASANIEFFTRPGAASRAVRVLARLATHMDEHLDLEDDHVLPMFSRLFHPAEFAELEQHAVEAIGLGAQAAFTVPFIVDAMSPADREHTLAGAPKPLKVLYRLTRSRHARLDRALFLGAGAPSPVFEVAS